MASLSASPLRREEYDPLCPTLNAMIFSELLRESSAHVKPYFHYFVEGVFTPELTKALENLPLEGVDEHYTMGRREEFNSLRQYFNPLTAAQHACAQTVSDVFFNRETIKMIEDKGNVCLKDSLLRIEYAVDRDGFWLEPHTDIGVKLFTMIVYLTDHPDAKEWGTDVYFDADNHYGAVTYVPNSALIFFPSADTWHGFEARKISGIRRSLIINYVTQEWRNRHELCHPTRAVY